MSALLRRLDDWQRRRRWLAFSFAVVKKFGEDQGGNLAALIAYYAIFSLFPLLLVLVTILGFILQGNPHLEHTVMGSALKDVPLIGDHTPKALHGSVPALAIGTILALWGGLGVAKSAQNAFNTVYLVPRHERPNFLKSTVRALYLVSVGGSGLIVTTAVTSAVTSVHAIDGVAIGPGLRVVGILFAVASNAALFLLLFRWLTVRHVRWRDAVPGAVLTAALLQVFQVAATAFIGHKLKGATPTYGNFASVIVLLSWFYLQAQVVLLAAEVNVVRQYKLWPRALADPPATQADLRIDEAYAESNSP